MHRQTPTFSANADHFKSLAALAVLIALTLPAQVFSQLGDFLDTDLARERFGATGDGVLIAFIDQGIDWRNDDFRAEDGSTRIEYLYDLSDPSGAADPGNTFNRGTIYSKADINAALANDIDLGFDDAMGAATAVAGIAAGNGRGSNIADFRGIAPNASIIAVKAFSHGAPTHGSKAAEPPFYSPVLLATAIDFVAEKAHELGLPTVVLLNYGRQGGPTDGTSLVSQQINFYSNNSPRLVFVTGTGDSGAINSRAAGAIPPGESVSIQIEKTVADPLWFDLWYPTSNDDGIVIKPLTVSLQSPNATVYGPYNPPSFDDFASDRAEPNLFSLYHRSATFNVFDADNGLREILIEFSGNVGQYQVNLTNDTAESIEFQASLDVLRQAGSAPSHFLNHIAPGTLWDGAAANEAIVVTGYANASSWVDIDGTTRSDDPELGSEGQLATRSSLGPTFDGRHTTDIAAPAGSLFSTYDSESLLATDRSNLISSAQGHYGRIGGTGAAAATVTGVVALMLAQNPESSAAEITAQLRTAAATDLHTGTVPNADWGSGKLSPSASIYLASLSSQEGIPVRIDGFTSSANDEITISHSTIQGLSYKTQYQEALLPANWEDLTDFADGDGSEQTVSTGLSPLEIGEGAYFRVIAK